MSTVITLKAQIEWHATRSADSGCWIGVCDAMNLAMQADSLDELHDLINEAMHLLFTDLLKENELEPFLRERGWKAQNLPHGQQAETVEFDVPWQLVAEGAHGSARVAG